MKERDVASAEKKKLMQWAKIFKNEIQMPTPRIERGIFSLLVLEELRVRRSTTEPCGPVD